MSDQDCGRGPPPPNRRLTIEYLDAEALKLDPRNPRHHPDAQIRKLAKSLGAFGQNLPIAIDANLNVVTGEAILLACRRLGWASVAVVRLEHLSEAELRLYSIASNQLATLSSWNERLLAENLRDLLTHINLDIELSGLEAAEIDFRVSALEAVTEDDEDDVPAVDPEHAVTKVGDLWVFPRGHRLLCADALEASSFDLLMAGAKAALAITDPPYGGKISGYVGLGQIQHREFVQGSEGMSADELFDFLRRACGLLKDNIRPAGLAYVFMDWRGIGALLSAGNLELGELKNLAVWVKDVPGMGSFYRSQHELCAVFKNGKGRHRNNVQLGRFGRNRSNVWHYAGMAGLGRRTEEGDLLAMHPTVKPITMIADAILDASVRREVVLDPFLGSGTCLLASERTGRRCYGLELDPLYVDLAVRRLMRINGEEPIEEASGKAFSHVAAERGVLDA